MPTNGKKKDSLLFAILDVINVLINFSFLKLCSALVTVTTHFCKLEKQDKRALTGITIELKVQRY